MKKLLASLLVLAMCAPAMAVTFSTSATDNVLTISYDLAEGEVLRGLALTVARQSGDGVVANDQDHNFGPFNTFMDYAYMAPTEYQIDTGHPFALVSEAGVAAFPASEFAISLGYLDQNGVEPKGEGITEDGSITIVFTAGAQSLDTEVAVALDTLRGGAVGDGLTTIDDSGLVNQTLTFPSQGCATCPGDFDGNGVVQLSDLMSAISVMQTGGFADMDTAHGSYNACSDYNGDGVWQLSDLMSAVAVLQAAGFADIACP